MTSNRSGAHRSVQMSWGEAKAMYDRLSRRARRRRAMRPLKTTALVIGVIAGTLFGAYLLLVVFTPVDFSGNRPAAGRSSAVTGSGSQAPVMGHLIVVRGGPSAGIYSLAPDGTGLQLLDSAVHDEDAVPSPDGTRVAFVRDGIYVMNADGTGEKQLTTDPSDSGPTWSPDGSTIAFSREVPGPDGTHTDIFTVPASGGSTTRVTNDLLQKLTPAWSPDGKQIAFAGYKDVPGQGPTSVQLYVMNSDGSSVELLGGSDVAQPVWSPDGSQIAFAGEGGTISVIRADGTDLRTVYAPPSGQGFTFSPAWSPDGSAIAFVSGNTVGNLQVFMASVDGSGSKQVTTGQFDALDVSWAPR